MGGGGSVTYNYASVILILTTVFIFSPSTVHLVWIRSTFPWKHSVPQLNLK
jgi:hypothetical protein